MKKHFVILLSITILALQGVMLKAQDEVGKRIPDISTWSEKQVKQWEDSVKNALYPDLEIGTMKMPADTMTGGMVLKIGQATNNTYVPNSVTIDKNKAVGEIPLSSAVSPTGAITYNVPIEVYPGIHGMQPELSISYNNQSRNGRLGVGWSIGGLSSIMRGNRCIYYDGKSQGIVMTKDDAFYLDGMRLIKQSGTTTQIKYESEQGNIKATANLNGTVITYFDVYFPNGKKGTYGYTSNTDIDYLEYPLTTMSDLYGNSITYTYTYTSNHYRITKASYANASVTFQYQTDARQDVITTYSGGLKVTENKLLQKIICKYGSTVLRNYDLTYRTQKSTSFLTQIDYSAANGSSFNPLKFYYGENNTATAYTKNETQLVEWYVWTDKNQIRVNKGKFDYGSDNDGLIVSQNKNSYWQNTSSKKFENLFSGTEKIFLYTGLNSSIASPMPNLTTEAGFIDILCANVDGKGEDEVVKVNDVVSGTNDKITFKTYSANVYTGLGLKYTRTFNFPTVVNTQSVQPKYYFTGDFNGDGKMEILAVSCHQPFGMTDRPTKCYLFDLESNSKLYEGQPFAYNVTFLGTTQTDPDTALKSTDRLYVFDYDGDGKSDLCLINTTGTHIYTFDISGSTYTMRQVSSYTGLKRASLDGKELMIGEFNGDGKPDFLLSPKVNDMDWYIYYSMGNGMFGKVSTSIYPRYSTYSYLLQDANSDGLTDVMEYTKDCFWTYRAVNGGFSSYESYQSFTNTNPVMIPTNVNNRSYFHQLIALKDGKVTRFSYPRNDSKEMLLTGSVTSLSVVNKNYYRMLNDANGYYGFYTKGSGATYPYENFQGPLFVPEYREQYFNGVRNENLNYMYENAVIHKQGRGLCGFEKITTYDNVRGRTQTQKFDPYNFSILKEDDSPTAKTTNTYSISVASNKIAKIRLTKQSAQDKLRGITVTSDFTYDTYGNPKTETINYGGGITDIITNTFSNTTTEPGYLLGFLTNRTDTVNRNGETWPVRYRVTAYSNGQPEAVIRYSNGNQVSYETFIYNSKGNPTKKGIKAYTSTDTLTTNYVYDSYGRLTKETDPLGFNTTYTYNSTNGSLSQVKNHKNQAIVYSYDAFGRNDSTYYPGGIYILSGYSWSAKGANGLYSRIDYQLGNTTIKTSYDALGRETGATRLLLNGVEPLIEKQYDSYGRLQKVSLPYTGKAASYWNSYQYDSYDRPTILSEASGRITLYSYSGKTVTTTEDGIASTQTFDNQGNLTKVSDPAGSITYNLRPDGQPSSVVAPGSVTTSFTYDKYGRRLSIVDPSAGTQSCTYSAAGDIATETDANSKKISYKYDAYNRLTTKTFPEFTVYYRYNSDGLLVADSINSTRFTAYTYDTYGRLNKEKETVPDGKWLEKTNTYADGCLQSTKYASQSGTIVTENYAYTSGYLTEIKLNGTTSIWKITAANVFGQPTGVTTGNIARTYSYNAYGLLTGRKAGSFQNQTYSFDAVKGNLTNRKDNIKNIQEDFTYDNLNRLTGYAGKKATYNVNGNINSKTDVGTFQYNTTGKPYALSGVTSPTSLIPQRNQTITYTSFRRPASITEGDYTAAFTFNGNNERVKMELKKNGAKELNRYYISDCYEVDDRAVGGIKEKLYLGGDFYTASAVYVKEGSGSWNIYYICRDYLGSITHITNSSGTVVQELSYDAWGQLRNPANQSVYAPGAAPEPFLGRGYTGHEHLSMFGLVNMNARLYDPALGRFLSPDPFVQDPLFSQSFNRYSYCLNNPLIYSDPDGEYAIIDDLIAAVVGGAVNVIVNAFQGNIHSWGQGFSYFGVGAGGTWAGLYAGPVASGLIIGAGNNFVTQGFGSSGNWNWNNINYSQVAMNGIMGAGMGFISSELSGYISPYVTDLFSGVSGQAVQQGLTQTAVGAGTGFAIGTGAALLDGESLGDALKAGGNGAALGAMTGLVSGISSGMRSAYKVKENPWTGKELNVKQQNTPDWNYGDHKSQTKWENQMKQRGWTEQQIDEAIFKGESYPAPNNINPNNGATRYVHPTTGRSVVVDNATGKILHVGGDGFKY